MFKEAKWLLLEVGGNTKLATGMEFLHSDMRKLARMTPLQAFMHIEELVEQIIGDAGSVKKVKCTLSYLLVRNIATPDTLCQMDS